MNMHSQNDIRVTSNSDDVLQFLPNIIEGAKSESSALGFIPSPEYEAAAIKDRLAIAARGSDFLGFVLFGAGAHRVLKIIQTFVVKSHRKAKVGEALIKCVIDRGNELKCSSVVARVATELDANHFWQAMGFKILHKQKGHGTKRDINIYEFPLEAKSLFHEHWHPTKIDDLMVSKNPVVGSPRYAIDINILLDLLHQRKNERTVKRLMRSALSGAIDLYITDEFLKELFRNDRGHDDHLLKFIRETLPILPLVDIPSNLIQNLENIVMPNKRVVSDHDKSDLMHLAQCIEHEMTGFITNDQKLLTAYAKIKEEYNVEIVAAIELFESQYENDEPLQVGDMTDGFEIRQPGHPESSGIVDFLRTNFTGSESAGVTIDLMPDPQSSYIAVSGDRTIGVLITRKIPAKIPTTSAVICIEDSSPAAASIANCLLGILLSSVRRGLSIIELVVPPIADTVRNQATLLGFVRVADQRSRFIKYSCKQIVNEKNWKLFADGLKNKDIVIEKRLLSWREYLSATMYLSIEGKDLLLNPFVFEILFSPVILMCPGREGVMVPIKQRFASLINADIQLPMFMNPQSTIRAERAYFASPKAIKVIKKGVLLVFYVSGSDKGGRMEAVGICRVTASGVYNREVAVRHFKAQGVYTDEDIKALGDDVGVFTFDRYTPFDRPIPYDKLLKMECISKANIVSSQRLTPDQLTRIVKEGFRE